jgi:hypothetical protein
MSRVLHILNCFVCAAALSTALQAQSQSQVQAPTETAAQTPPSTPIDASKLGISFDRVRMQLTQTSSSTSKGLKIQETIEVVGKAPTPLFWNPKTVNLTSAAVPFGGPTQKDIMKLIVPKEFQNYPFDLNALMQWLAEHLNKKSE